MSNPEAQPAPAPRLLVRLALWLGIYLFGFAMFVVMMVRYDQQNLGDPDVSQEIGPRRLMWMLLMFPYGLACFFDIPMGYFWPILSYATYLLHLILTYRVKTGRVFVLLMLVLVALVTCNLIGCSEATSFPPHR